MASENRSLGERSVRTRARAASAASGATGALGTPPTPPGPAPPSPTAALPVEPLKYVESVRKRQIQRVSTVHEKGGWASFSRAEGGCGPSEVAGKRRPVHLRWWVSRIGIREGGNST